MAAAGAVAAVGSTLQFRGGGREEGGLSSGEPEIRGGVGWGDVGVRREMAEAASAGEGVWFGAVAWGSVKNSIVCWDLGVVVVVESENVL